MSLSAWERQTLDSIGNGLAESDPELATLLTTFARLASGEEMPAAEEISGASWPSMRRSLRKRRRSRWGGLRRFLGRMNRGLGMRWMVLSLWLAVTASLMCIPLFLGNGSGVSCSVSWAAVCMAPAARPAADKTATSHEPRAGARRLDDDQPSGGRGPAVDHARPSGLRMRARLRHLHGTDVRDRPAAGGAQGCDKIEAGDEARLNCRYG